MVKRIDDLLSELLVKCNLFMVASWIEEIGSDTRRYAVEAPAKMIAGITNELSNIVEELLGNTEENAEK